MGACWLCGEAPVAPGLSFPNHIRAHLLTTRYAGGGMAFGHRALCEADAAPAGACRE